MSTESNKSRKIFDGRYEIVSIVGRGAASVVYHGRRATAPYADVAIKVLTDKGASIPAKERLRKEALAMLYARHRYVVRLDDFRAVGDLCYLSMEFAPHRDLRHYITERGNECTAAQRERYFTQAAEALGYVHRAGLIHRDIKPDNILVMNEAEIRIADFGVAVLPSDEASLSDLQRGVGTMEYLAPEVLDGVRCDQRSDVYGLGVTFYELLAGQHPFSQAPLAEQLDVRKDGAVVELIQVAPHVPDYINAAIMRCLAFDPAARFENGQQLFESLLLGRDKSKRKTKNRVRPPSGQGLSSQSAEAHDDPLGMITNSDAGTALPSQLAIGDIAPTNEEMLVERDVSRETVLIPKEEVAAVRTGETPPSPSRSRASHQSFPPLSTSAEKSMEEPTSSTMASPTEQIAGARRETSTRIQTFTSERSMSKDSPALVSSNHRFEPLSQAGSDKAQVFSEFIQSLRIKAADLVDKLGTQIEALQADPKTRRYIPIGAVIATFLLGLLLFSGGGSRASKTTTADKITQTVISESSQPVSLSFPKLQPGRYEGRIDGLVPGRTTPLAFIVPTDTSSVITLIGLEGWTPIKGRYPTGDAPEKLRVSSNGFLIDFTGRVEGDSIIGFFRDQSTGAQGRWEARVSR